MVYLLKPPSLRAASSTDSKFSKEELRYQSGCMCSGSRDITCNATQRHCSLTSPKQGSTYLDMAKRESRIQKMEGLVKELNRNRGEELFTVYDGTFRTESVDPRALLLFVKKLQALENRVSDYTLGVEKRRGEIRKIRRSINGLLDRYRAKPFLLISDVHPHLGWELTWVSRSSGTSHQTHELQALLAIVEVAREGRISALKQCEQCRKWLFARFSHQRFCSEDCKEQFHRTNEADKKRRREWARENYWTRKVLETGSRTVKTAKRVRKIK